MQRKEDLIGYDFQGWPIFKQNLEELLLDLGGKIIDNKIVFDKNSPYLKEYPTIFIDDGMAYGTDKSYSICAECFKDGNKHYINIFREKEPSKEKQKELFNRWDEDNKL